MRRLVPLLALALVPGCGGGGDDGSKDLLANAASKTTKAGSARIAFSGRAEAGTPQPVEFKGDGVVDNSRRLGRLTFDFASLAEALRGSGIDESDLEGEVIFDEFDFYMRFPALTAQLEGGKEWVKFDLEAVSEAQGIDLSQFTQFGQADPSQALQYLRALSGEVEEKGKEDVRGVSTTRYAAEVDLEKFPDVLPEEQRDGARKSVESLVKQLGGDSTLPMEVWVDDDGLIRRQRFDFSFEPEGGREVSFRYDIELYDFGVELDVQPPPADKTVDFTQLLAQESGS